jgi:very-short-patch-repair endonuclease
MGWKELMLAVEYDGEQHREDPKQFAKDILRSEDLDELGWSRLRVVKSNRAADVLRRLDRMWRSKLQTDREFA